VKPVRTSGASRRGLHGARSILRGGVACSRPNWAGPAVLLQNACRWLLLLPLPLLLLPLLLLLMGSQ